MNSLQLQFLILIFTDGQRRRLAAKAKAIGCRGLFEIGTLVRNSRSRNIY